MPSITRQPYKEKLIQDLSKDDEFICIAGHPVLIKENLLVLDDGFSTINIYLNDSMAASQPKFMRVFGKVIEIDGKLALQSDFIQDISKIDTFLYNKVRKLTKI